MCGIYKHREVLRLRAFVHVQNHLTMHVLKCHRAVLGPKGQAEPLGHLRIYQTNKDGGL